MTRTPASSSSRAMVMAVPLEMRKTASHSASVAGSGGVNFSSTQPRSIWNRSATGRPACSREVTACSSTSGVG